MSDNIQEVTSPVVPDAPFPQDQAQNNSESGGGVSGGSVSSPVVKETGFPVRTMAIEVLSTAFNTISRTIEDTFSFTKMGAIQIGEYINAISGQILISPNGISAKNKDGIDTFAIDGTTGNAIFAGTVRAGSTIVADTIVTEQASSGNGRTVYYNDGLPSIVIGDPS